MARMRVPQKPNHTDKPTDKEPCLCCGREIKGEWQFSVEMDTANYAIEVEHPSRIAPWPSSQGFYPIGPTCAMWLMRYHREFFDTCVHVN